MEYSTILYNLEETILTITLNRPELLNAFNRTMMSEIIDALDRADADDQVRDWCHRRWHEGDARPPPGHVEGRRGAQRQVAGRGPARGGPVEEGGGGLRPRSGALGARLARCLAAAALDVVLDGHDQLLHGGVFMTAADDVEGLHQGNARRHHGGQLAGEDGDALSLLGLTRDLPVGSLVR